MRTEELEVQFRSEAEAWTSLPDSVSCLRHKLLGEAQLKALKPPRDLLIQIQRQICVETFELSMLQNLEEKKTEQSLALLHCSKSYC